MDLTTDKRRTTTGNIAWSRLAGTIIKKIAFLFFIVLFSSLTQKTITLEDKINLFVKGQRSFLFYNPKSKEEKDKMLSGLGKIDSSKAIFSKNLILFRKNNLPDDRTPKNYITYTFIKFNDSIQCKEALINWLNCFGVDCWKVGYKTNLIGLKTEPIFIIINSDEIVIAHTQCNLSYNRNLKPEIWNNVIKDLKKAFATDHSEYIDVGCGGPLIWNY